MFFVLLCGIAAAAPVAGQDVNVVEQPTSPASAPQTDTVQAAPNNTTVVQPTPAPTVVQAPAPAAAAPVVVDREPDTRQAVVQQTNIDSDDDAPSVFATAAQGLFAGALVGSSAGYLVGRKDGWERSDWRSVGLGLGIGALSGTGLGLMLGFVDRGGVRAGRYIPRDMLAGTALGAVIGLVSGGIAAAGANEPERVLFGTSVGALAGAGLGIITGIVEGQLKGDRETRTTAVTSRLKLEPSVAWERRTHGSGALLTGLAGRF
jgi:hypothetical protein